MMSPRYHVIFDLDHCRDTITDAETIRLFIVETIASIGMRIIGGPLVCEGVPENPGLSGFAVLDFSHISVHTFTKHGEALVDVFSCKPFDRAVARRHVLNAFGTPESSVREQVVHWEEEMVVPSAEFDYRREYLREYFEVLRQEYLDIGEFLREASAPVQDRLGPLNVLDAGCGPTMLYWAPFLWEIASYHGLDIRQDNVAFVRDMVEEGKRGVMPSWIRDPYVWAAKKYGESDVTAFYQKICERVQSLVCADMHGVWPLKDASFTFAFSAFGLECMDGHEEMLHALREMHRLLAPGGRVACVTLEGCERWKCGPTVLRCVRLHEENIRRLLSEAGFQNVHVRTHAASTAVERQQGYEAMLFAFADR